MSDLPHEGCERRGGVCDCGRLPCALDHPRVVELVRAEAARLGISVEQLLSRLDEYRPVVPPPGPERERAVREARRRLGL